MVGIREARWYNGEFSVEKDQMPSHRWRPIWEFAVGRTIEVGGEVWQVVQKKEVVDEDHIQHQLVQMKHLSGRRGRPQLCWLPGATQFEE